MSQHGCPERLSNRSKGFQEDGPSQPTMEVLVETLTGTAFEMTVSPSDTIYAIKSKIYRVEGIPVSQQHLVYNLRELEDALSLRAHGVPAGARLRLVLGMRGGPVATRRLPPPPEPWRDIERLLDSNREEGEWCSGSGSCRVTVLVFRDGERVNMLRVRQNRDGSYSPLDHAKYSSSLTQLAEQEVEEAGSLQQNAVTMGKMQELRKRMESLSIRRHHPQHQPRRARNGEKAEIQKTRSEETLSVPSLLDDASDFGRTYTPYSEAEDTFAPLYDGNYTRYDYGCSFADRYTLLPPIGARTDSEHSVDAPEERLKLSDALAGSILVKGRQRDDEAAILEECLEGVEECHIRQDSPQLAAKNLAPIPAAEYGPLVGGESGGWLGLGFAGSPLAAGALGAVGAAGSAHSHSASSLHARVAPPLAAPPALAEALFSSSTSDLEQLRRGRLLPQLARHRNTEHLHLSDDRLDRPPKHRQEVPEERRPLPPLAPVAPRPLPPGEGPPGRAHAGRGEGQPPTEGGDGHETTQEKDVKEKKPRVRCLVCRRRLSIATVHSCRCGGLFCAPHRYAEVHGCAYDYKAAARDRLRSANPRVAAPKLPKI